MTLTTIAIKRYFKQKLNKMPFFMLKHNVLGEVGNARGQNCANFLELFSLLPLGSLVLVALKSGAKFNHCG